MAMVKVTGFMPLDSVDEITIDGKKLEVNDLAVQMNGYDLLFP